MISLSRFFIFILAILGFTRTVLAEPDTDFNTLKDTKMFYPDELTIFPDNYAVVEFQISPSQFPSREVQPLLLSSGTENTAGEVLYLGVWSKDFLTYDPQRQTDSLSSYMYNGNKISHYYKMDLHSPTTVADEEDNWVMTTILPESGPVRRPRSLAEKPVPPSSFKLNPRPFPYRAVSTGYTCVARMIAAGHSSQEYTLSVSQEKQLLKAGILKNDSKIIMKFQIQAGTRTYNLNLKKGRHARPIISVSEKLALPKDFPQENGWYPLPMAEAVLPDTIHLTPAVPFFQQFLEKQPVIALPSDLRQGQVYWIFLEKNTEITMSYEYEEGNALEFQTLSPGWHFLATKAYQLDKSKLLKYIDEGLIHPAVYYFDATKQKYMKLEDINSDKSLQENLFFYKTK